MKTRTLTQTEKPHNTNHLHDAFIAAAISPLQVESTPTESRFRFDDAVANASIEAVITAYVLTPPPVPVDIRVAWQNYKNAVNNASTVAQIKSALTTELGVLLKEILKSHASDLT